MEDDISIEEQDVFEPVSELAGNIEITFNSRNNKIDMYEPMSEQVVFTIGKTGRANRLSFDEPTSESIGSLISALEKVKNQLENIEERDKVDDEGELDLGSVSEISEEERSRRLLIKSIFDEFDEDSLEIKDLIEIALKSDKFDNKEEVEDVLQSLKREGEMFEPQQGDVQLI